MDPHTVIQANSCSYVLLGPTLGRDQTADPDPVVGKSVGYANLHLYRANEVGRDGFANSL